MKLIDELKKFRNALLGISERDYEFDAELEDHEIPNSNYYRLHYVEFYRKNEQINPRPDNIGITNWPCSTFMLPEGISKIRVYAWVEGQDIDCENNAAGSDFKFNFNGLRVSPENFA